MARPTLFTHRKFRRLAAAVGNEAHAAGYLEMLWRAAYESGDPLLGDAQDVEAAACWPGEPGAGARLLLDAGFIDQCEDGRYEVHDLWDHAPRYVQRRAEREEARRAAGKSLSEARAEAGRAGAEAANAKRRTAARRPSEGPATGRQVDSQLPANGQQLAGKLPSLPTPHSPLPTPAPAPAPKEEEYAPAGASTARVLPRPEIPSALLAVEGFAELWEERLRLLEQLPKRDRPAGDGLRIQLQQCLKVLKVRGPAAVIEGLEMSITGKVWTGLRATWVFEQLDRARGGRPGAAPQPSDAPRVAALLDDARRTAWDLVRSAVEARRLDEHTALRVKRAIDAAKTPDAVHREVAHLGQ